MYYVQFLGPVFKDVDKLESSWEQQKWLKV